MTIDELKFLTVGDVIDTPFGPGLVTQYVPVYYRPAVKGFEGIHLKGRSLNTGTQIHADAIVEILSIDLQVTLSWMIEFGIELYVSEWRSQKNLNEFGDVELDPQACSVLYKAGT